MSRSKQKIAPVDTAALFGPMLNWATEGPPPADTRYQRDPIAWMVERMGIPENTLRWSMSPEYQDHVWDGDKDPLQKIVDALVAHENVGVESATGTGKTFFGALIVLWFLDVFVDALVVTMAPKEAQLTLHIWKEIGALWPKFQKLRPHAELTKLRIRMTPGNDKWSAQGFACAVGADETVATKAQGFHAEHMLFITEETPGIPIPIMAALENTCTAPHNLQLAFGNPDSQTDALHAFCLKEGTKAIRISALDHPNVVLKNADIVPGAVSIAKIESRRKNYGVDSRLYQSRVRGICPADATDAIIRWAWCVDAAKASDERKKELMAKNEGVAALGVDVANSQNGDRGSIAQGIGAVLTEVTARPCPDANQLGRDVVTLMTAVGINPRNVGVDCIGVGSGCVNEIKRLGFRIQALNSSDGEKRHTGEEVFANLRSQMWWQLREDVRKGEVVLPNDPEVWQDICEPRWKPVNGKITVEPKDNIRQRLGRSPDKGDSVVYWNWVRQKLSGSTLHADLVTF